MYYYLYHPDMQSPKQARLAIGLEVKLNKLGLTGKTTKLGHYTNLIEKLAEIVFTNQDTLVVVGDDELFFNTVNLIGHKTPKPIMAYVPITAETNLTKNLGLPVGETAVMVVANRRLEYFDLGSFDNDFFFSSILIPSHAVALACNDKYTITTPPGVTHVEITNLKTSTCHSPVLANSSPQDGCLDVVFFKQVKQMFGGRKKSVHSVFRVNQLAIRSTSGSEIQTIVDECRVKKTPLIVKVKPRELKVIVGKNRLTSR